MYFKRRFKKRRGFRRIRRFGIGLKRVSWRTRRRGFRARKASIRQIRKRLHGEVLRYQTPPDTFSINTTVGIAWYWNSWLYNDNLTTTNPNLGSNNGTVQGNKFKIVKLGFNMDVKMLFTDVGTALNATTATASFTYRVICWRVPRRLGPFYVNETVVNYDDITPVRQTDPSSTENFRSSIFNIPSNWGVIPTFLERNPQGIAPYQIVFDKTYTLTLGNKTFNKHKFRFGEQKVLQYADQSNPNDDSQEIKAVKNNLYGITVIIVEKRITTQNINQTPNVEIVTQKTYKYVDN